MKWNAVPVFLMALSCGMPFGVQALATVESRTAAGEPGSTSSGYSAEPSSTEMQRNGSTESRAVSGSMEDRAARLTLKQLEALKQEINELRGLLENQEHELEKLRKSQQDLYLDLDKRLNQMPQLKKTLPGSTPPKTNAVSISLPKTDKPSSSSVSIVPTGSLSETELVPPAVEPVVGTTAPLKEKEVYEAAYNLVRTKQYSEAATAFQGYIARFPQGEYAANAYYWLGEVYMAQWQADKAQTSALDNAAKAFLSINARFPTHAKAPDALLKLALIETERGNPEVARKYFNELRTRYPGSAAARIAETRLKQ